MPRRFSESGPLDDGVFPTSAHHVIGVDSCRGPVSRDHVASNPGPTSRRRVREATSGARNPMPGFDDQERRAVGASETGRRRDEWAQATGCRPLCLMQESETVALRKFPTPVGVSRFGLPLEPVSVESASACSRSDDAHSATQSPGSSFGFALTRSPRRPPPGRPGSSLICFLSTGAVSSGWNGGGRCRRRFGVPPLRVGRPNGVGPGRLLRRSRGQIGLASRLDVRCRRALPPSFQRESVSTDTDRTPALIVPTPLARLRSSHTD